MRHDIAAVLRALKRMALFVTLAGAGALHAQGTTQATSGTVDPDNGVTLARNPRLLPGAIINPMAGTSSGIASLYEEQGQLKRGSQNVTTLGADLFGDQVNLYTGALEFVQTDVGVPGNSSLAVSVGRRYSPGRHQMIKGQLGDWDLDLPRLQGVFPTSTGWVDKDGGQARCSKFGEVKPVYAGGYYFQPWEFWQGVNMHVPGAGTQELLHRGPTNTAAPTDGNSYPLVTQKHWQIRCLPSLARGTGEGFIAVSPEGVQYRFDWMATRTIKAMRGPGGSFLGRQEVSLLATEVRDRFGNTVRYTYDPSAPTFPQSIQASDGRQISFGRTTAAGGPRIASVSDGTRTWTYGYDSTTGNLTSVTLPDASQWTFTLTGMTPPDYDLGEGANCDWPGAWPSQNFLGSIKHPSGATGTFTTAFIGHGRSAVVRACYRQDGPPESTVFYALWPKEFVTQALTAKSISGPGLPALNWSYQWSPTNGTWSDCSGCTHPDSKTVSVTDPRGYVTRHTYGVRFQVNEGQLLKVEEGFSGNTAVRSTSHRYRQPAGMSYPEPVGTSPSRTSDYLSARLRPQDQRLITQQGTNFTWEATTFDSFGRSLTINRNGPGGSRSETTSYSDHPGLWVLGQIDRVTSGGLTMVDNDYHPSTALLSRTTKFGVLQYDYTYHADGNLATRKDGRNYVTNYKNYKRGLPQLVEYPNGSSETAIVNDIGLIKSVTNAANYTTGYDYDAVGRLSGITPPTGWTATTLVFAPVASTEYDLPAGHWRQTITHGNAKTVTYFDGLWRPMMTRTYDTADEANTRKVIVRNFDADGRTVYESYAQRNATSVSASLPAGTRRLYDALGRETESRADSELGTLLTRTDYLSGFQTRITNPRNYQTTQSFQAFDQPAEAQLTGASAPEGVTLTIARDSFGKATSISRSGLYAGQSVSAIRRYVYDSGQRLCKTIEPESGATVQDYDGAGNVAWRASGQNLPSTTACDHASVPAAARISFTYTPLDLLENTTYGDGSPGITRNYTADGRLRTITSNGAAWTYDYNSLRLLTSESLVYGGQTYTIGWGYNGAAHLSSLTYPNNSTLTYNPNALGQPRQVGGFASNVAFHPNGAVAGYTLGNGIAHSLSQNTRGLPLLNRDAGVLQDLYGYDANGNVATIADQQDNVFNRTLGYDGLDRLKTANAPGVWGNASYVYDPLDNLRSSTVGSRSSTHVFGDATNRLTSLVTNGVATSYFYDARGNLKTKGAQTFTFDIGNRLASASSGGSYVYDGHGRRVRVVSTDGSTRIQVYSQAGQLLWATSTGGTRPASATGYGYLGGKLIVEVNTTTGLTQYAHTDALGSPVAHTSATGALLNRTRFEPYGHTAAGTVPGPATSLIGFTGHVNDPETGLVYMQQRYHDPIAGRFLSVDPITTEVGHGEHFNRYSYADNRPYKFVDPDGRGPSPIPDEQFTGGGRGGGILGPLGPARALDGSPLRLTPPSRAAAPTTGSPQPTPGDKAAAIGRPAGPATDRAGTEIGRIVVDSRGNAMIEPAGGRTVPAGKGGVDTHTLYPNGSNYQRLNPKGHTNNPTPHGHGHAPGTGPGMKGQGASLDVTGKVVPSNSPAAHWPIN